MPCNMDSVARLVTLRHKHKDIAFGTLLIEPNWREFWIARKPRGSILAKLSNYMMFRFLFLYKDTLPIRLKPCAIWEVWAYPLRIEQTFSTPLNLQTIKRPKLLETLGNGKTSTFLKVWFLENVKFVKVFSHHKLIQDSQEYFKHLEFSHILRMRRYRMRWKTLKMQKNRKIFQTNSHKSYENLQRICIRHHIASH